MGQLALVKFDKDSTTFAGQFAIQERGWDGSFQGLYTVEGETLATRGSLPKASWSVVRILGDSFDDEDFWNFVEELRLEGCAE